MRRWQSGQLNFYLGFYQVSLPSLKSFLAWMIIRFIPSSSVTVGNHPGNLPIFVENVLWPLFFPNEKVDPVRLQIISATYLICTHSKLLRSYIGRLRSSEFSAK